MNESELLFQSHAWFSLLNDHGKRLVMLSEKLYAREVRLHTHYESYTFVVFPMSKAYEGFLKYYLKEMGLLNNPSYSDSKFRIGRALNPDIQERHKDEWWLYDDLERMCSKETARALWNAWLECRNKLFHFYFDDELPLPLPAARKKLLQMSTAMDQAMECAKK